MVAFHWVDHGRGLVARSVVLADHARTDSPRAMYYPLATAIAALATAQLVGSVCIRRRLERASLAAGPAFRSHRTAVRRSSRAFWRSWPLCSRGVRPRRQPRPAAVFAALALGLVALRTGWTAAAFAGGCAGSWRAAIVGLLIASRLDRTGLEPRSIYAARGRAGRGILALEAGRNCCAGMDSTAKPRFRRISEASESGPVPLALAFEWAAFASTLFAAIAVLAAGSQPAAALGLGESRRRRPAHGGRGAPVMLVPRWKREWLVYLAQAMIVAAYVDFRMAYPWPIAADAAVLTLLGYLDLGLAELLDRQQLTIYARPVRFTLAGSSRSSRCFSCSGSAARMRSRSSIWWPRRRFTAWPAASCAGSRSDTRRASCTTPLSGCSGASSAGSSRTISSSSWSRSASPRSSSPNPARTSWAAGR